MDLKLIHPELRKAYRMVPGIPFHNKLFVKMINSLFKLWRAPDVMGGIRIEDHACGHRFVRVYMPPACNGAGMLWIHGGGLITGRPALYDELCSRYARDLNIVVVSVSYRLADKHPYPAAIDDCYNAWQWLQQNAEGLGVDPERIAISGQSAGGGLAASLVQRVVDSGGIQPAAQLLFCPMLDDRTAARKELDSVNHKMWNNRSNRAGWSAYLGQPVGSAEVPKYSVPARRENLMGLPPSWIGVGDVDLFFEEDKRYFERLVECGVESEFHVAPMAPHAFELLVARASITRELFQSNYNFLRHTLGLDQ